MIGSPAFNEHEIDENMRSEDIEEDNESQAPTGSIEAGVQASKLAVRPEQTLFPNQNWS